MYLLDTDIVAFFLRGNAHVVRRIAEHVADPRAISVITYAELLYGAARSARSVENAAQVRRLSDTFRVVDVTPTIVETFTALKLQTESSGEKLDDFDLLIAATAIHLGYSLVTNNTRHFRRIPELTLENWAA